MNLHFERLQAAHIPLMVPLVQDSNPTQSPALLQERLQQMFASPCYLCFGAFENGELIGVSGAWLSTRLYSGKQIELDNVVVKAARRSQGIGRRLMSYIYDWARRQGCLTCELNSYVHNGGSHKFYFNEDFQIIGYHFQKRL